MTQESIPTRDTSTTDPVVTGATDPTIPEETTEGTSSVTPSQQLWVTLDQSDADYAPGETVGITASNVSTGGSLEFSVGHVSAGADGILGTADDVISGDLTGTGTPWVVTDGGAGDLDGLVNGAIQTSWYVNADALNQAFVLSAIDQASGQVATASFTDAAPPDASGAAADLTKDLSAVPGGDPTHNIGGALFQVYHVKSDFGQSAGTGTFDTFVQVQGPNNPPTEQGYNYDRSGTYGDVLSPQYNENTSGEHNTALLLSEIPIVTINGVNYRNSCSTPMKRPVPTRSSSRSTACRSSRRPPARWVSVTCRRARTRHSPQAAASASPASISSTTWMPAATSGWR